MFNNATCTLLKTVIPLSLHFQFTEDGKLSFFNMLRAEWIELLQSTELPNLRNLLAYETKQAHYYFLLTLYAFLEIIHRIIKKPLREKGKSLDFGEFQYSTFKLLHVHSSKSKLLQQLMLDIDFIFLAYLCLIYSKHPSNTIETKTRPSFLFSVTPILFSSWFSNKQQNLKIKP